MAKKLVLVSRNLGRGREPKRRIILEDGAGPATRGASELRVLECSDSGGDVFATCGEERSIPKRYRIR